MRRNGWVVAVAAAILLAHVAATWAGDGDRVGPLGDPARLAFDGPTPATPDRLRTVLGGDPDVQAAADPGQPLDDYVTVLRQRLTVGLSTVGYPDATVAVTPDGKRMSVRFHLGPRRRPGAVKVDGDTDHLDVPALVKRLTTAATPGPFDVSADQTSWTVRHTRATADVPDAAWTPGEGWADFTPFTAGQLAVRVRGALAELGYFRPMLRVTVDDDGTAGVLHVHVLELGPPAVVGPITVTGNTANPAAAVADLLGLRKGQRLDAAAVQAAQQRVWDSGRFAKHTVRVDVATDGTATVAVHVDEAGLPPIGTPFTPEEQIMLRFRTWLLAQLADGHEVEVEVDVPSFGGSLTMGSRVGMVGRLRLGTTLAGGRPISERGGIVLVRDAAGVWLPDQRRRCITRAGGYQVRSVVRFEGGDDPGDGPWAFVFDWGAQSVDAGDQPVRFTVVLAPSYFVHMGQSLPSSQTTLRDGVLSVRSAPTTVPATVDAGSGEARIKADTGELLAFAGRSGSSKVSFRIVPAGATAAAAAAALAGDEPNAADPAMPYASVASFAFEQQARLFLTFAGVDPARATRAAAVIAKMASPANLAAFAMDSTDDQKGGDFELPPSADDRSVNGAASGVCRFLLPLGDQAFARGSWPWRLTRGAGLYVANRSTAAAAAMDGLYQDGGPLACLAAAELSSKGGPPAVTAKLATAGLGRLSDAAFERDVRALLADGTGMAAVTRQVVESVRHLTPGDVDDLVAGLPVASGVKVRLAIAALRANPDQPGERAAAELLIRVWPLGLRDAVSGELKRLAATPEP